MLRQRWPDSESGIRLHASGGTRLHPSDGTSLLGGVHDDVIIAIHAYASACRKSRQVVGRRTTDRREHCPDFSPAARYYILSAPYKLIRSTTSDLLWWRSDCASGMGFIARRQLNKLYFRSSKSSSHWSLYEFIDRWFNTESSVFCVHKMHVTFV